MNKKLSMIAVIAAVASLGFTGCEYASSTRLAKDAEINNAAPAQADQVVVADDGQDEVIAPADVETDSDGDADGVIDSKDQCPNSTSGEIVDAETGCPSKDDAVTEPSATPETPVTAQDEITDIRFSAAANNTDQVIVEFDHAAGQVRTVHSISASGDKDCKRLPPISTETHAVFSCPLNKESSKLKTLIRIGSGSDHVYTFNATLAVPSLDFAKGDYETSLTSDGNVSVKLHVLRKFSVKRSGKVIASGPLCVMDSASILGNDGKSVGVDLSAEDQCSKTVSISHNGNENDFAAKAVITDYSGHKTSKLLGAVLFDPLDTKATCNVSGFPTGGTASFTETNIQKVSTTGCSITGDYSGNNVFIYTLSAPATSCEFTATTVFGDTITRTVTWYCNN